MTRRNFIALISLCVLVALGAIALGVALFATQSEMGQTAMRKWVQGQVQSGISGKVYIGKIGGSFLTGITIDSLDLKDDEDSLVVATGRITLQYDPRDLVDRRLYFRRVDIEHPTIVLRQHENWKWNYKKLFKADGPQKRRVNVPERGFGDFVVLDSVHLHRGASLRVTIPWHPDDSLRGVKRDSAIRMNMARKDHEIRRTREGLTQTYRWTNSYAYFSHARIVDPDSAGSFFVIDTLHTDESTPPFMWRNVRGIARVLGDSAWTTISHFDLPGSTGTARGKVWWGSDLPVRYDMRIVGDSVSLADVHWVYPTLPRTGSGTMKLHVRNERNLKLLDYVISDMDVRSTKSRLIGGMTFEVGGPVLNVHDVKLRADPVDFDLLRTLNGKPFPADWQGKIRGTVTASGGPLTNFKVEESEFTFTDAHVPGAVSRMKGRGELDILFPAFTVFHNFFVSTDHLDIRTFPAIYPSFPRMKGIVTGSVVLDSSWLDVRVSNADLTHTDGPAEPSHATGGGRITYGVQFMKYDMLIQASPLSLTTLAESYPKFPLRGTLTGPVRVRGEAPDLDIVADLSGTTGHLTYAGKVDADSVGGYGARGSGIFNDLDAALLFGRAKPASQLAGTFDVSILGDTLANMNGSVTALLTQSVFDGMRVSRGATQVRFDNGLLHVDTLRLEGQPGMLKGRGVLGLTRAPANDSLTITFDADSLGGLRRYLGKAGATAPDSLGGTIAAQATVRGWLDSLDVRSRLVGNRISVNGDRAESVTGSLALTSMKELLTGTITLRADTVLAGGVHIDTAGASARILGPKHAVFSGGVRTTTGAAMRTFGDWRTAGDTMSVRVDTLNLDVGTSRWSLRRPSYFSRSPFAITLDTLLFADLTGARLAGYINAPESAPVSAKFIADSVPLSDVGLLAQLPSALAGKLSLAMDIGGTRDVPVMTLAATVPQLNYAGLKTDLVSIVGGYGANRANLQANVLKRGRSVLDATVTYPVSVSLFSARETGDSLRGRIHADSVELAIIEAFSPKLRNTAGRLALDLSVSGVPTSIHLGGTASLRDGVIEVPDVGIRFTEMDGDIRVDAASDSLSLSELRWTSPASGGVASLKGSVVYRDRKDPRIDLRLVAKDLRAVDKRGLARLDVSTDSTTGLVLAGTTKSARLSGDVQVARGTIYIPDIVRKQVVDLTAEDFAQLFDTTDVRNRSLMPQPPSALVENLQLGGVSIQIGEDVWLRSREASIKLGGSLNVTRVRDERETGRSNLGRTFAGDSARYRLALSGTLSADRGTYTLDLTAAQREFQVESGRITFFGTSDFNPSIDVSALYNLKQANRADIGIRARIHGSFFPQPALELSSTDAYLSPSDLVAYLVTGQPRLELSRQDLSAAQRAVDFLLPSLGASVNRALRDQLGGVVDLIQIQSGATNDATAVAGSSQFKSILSSTRLGGEKQIRDKLFLSVSTGLCQLGASSDNPDQQGLIGFANAIEGKLEYRFPLISPDRLSIRAGREPAASALRCGTGQVRGFVATPQQWGFSLFRSWSF